MYCIILLLIPAFTCAVPPQNTCLPTRTFESSYPYITGDTVRSFCDHILDATVSFDPIKVKRGDTVFVMVDHLEHFFDEYHLRITEPYILVTHHFFDNSDDDVPGRFAPYLDSTTIIAWFTHNADIVHPKLHLLPIGIGNAFYDFGHKPTFDICIRKYSNKVKKTGLLYMNFRINTYPGERQYVYNFFKDKPFVTCVPAKTLYIPGKSLGDYLKDVARHKFVLSPRGNGLDCFRTWEALLMGSYPVVKTSMLDQLFEGLPVVIVQDWSEVTPEFLEYKYREFSSQKYNMNKIYMQYWLGRIQAVKKAFLEDNQ